MLYEFLYTLKVVFWHYTGFDKTLDIKLKATGNSIIKEKELVVHINVLF